MGSSCLVRRSWTQASRILARVTIVEAWGAAVAVGEKVGARMVAKARNAMAARRKQGNSGDLAGSVERMFMVAPIVLVVIAAGEFADDVAYEVFGVAEEHQRLVEVIQRVVDAGKTGGHAALDDHDGARFVDVQD